MRQYICSIHQHQCLDQLNCQSDPKASLRQWKQCVNGFLATLIGGIKVVLLTLITPDQVPAASSAIAHSGSLYRWLREWVRQVSDNRAGPSPSLSVPVNWAATWQCHYPRLPRLNQTLQPLSDNSHFSQVSSFFPSFVPRLRWAKRWLFSEVRGAEGVPPRPLVTWQNIDAKQRDWIHPTDVLE